ncbi:tripartite tricarboxylate transporter substrate binding protein [Variovorax guangxiensis]|uniref:Bug family tripartite tricarboxylate transporter substrate binding protein n=1 Tax=Variovorax guangxiensis TaxID=1775474 RepID=UPI00285BA6F5|nr:tripartite tricarboxylate transporter substrate binding protein [Variovorax guangxiensis]MDR6858772.1 tripartite-type tricarboxylate transporter receptor subunit TctC [Variovorax guangxiensis]
MKFRSEMTLVLGLLLASPASMAQDYPARPIRTIVPLSPGSTTDVLVRLMATKMGASLGMPLVVENLPGAGAIVGTATVAKALPDGYTILVATASSFSVNPHVHKSLPYNPVKDFAPVCRIGGSANVLAVNSAMGVKSIPELLEKAKSGDVSFASAGAGTTSHLAQEMFKSRTGASFLHVPYKGTAQSVTDTVAGHAQVIFDTPGPLVSHIQSGKLIPLAVMSPRRSASLPNVPTFDELGMRGLYLQGWSALVAPAGTPAAIVDRLARACQSAVASADFQEQSRSRGFDIDYAGPAEFAAFIASEMPKWGNLVKLAGLKPE